MRMNRTEAAKNRERVVQTASEMFRKDGYDGTGIAALMKASGLNNGAFYKQFASKEALIAEATAHGLGENEAHWQKVLEQAEGDPLQAITDWYLSEPHLSHRGLGCTYATLATEAPRHEEDVQKAFDQSIRRTLSLLSGAAETGDTSDGAGEREREDAAIRHLSRLVGALILARAVAGSTLADRIVAANKSPD